MVSQQHSAARRKFQDGGCARPGAPMCCRSDSASMLDALASVVASRRLELLHLVFVSLGEVLTEQALEALVGISRQALEFLDVTVTETPLGTDVQQPPLRAVTLE